MRITNETIKNVLYGVLKLVNMGYASKSATT